ncbi:MAG: hypothetical protein RSD33_06875 [Clostridium sp.]
MKRNQKSRFVLLLVCAAVLSGTLAVQAAEKQPEAQYGKNPISAKAFSSLRQTQKNVGWDAIEKTFYRSADTFPACDFKHITGELYDGHDFVEFPGTYNWNTGNARCYPIYTIKDSEDLLSVYKKVSNGARWIDILVEDGWSFGAFYPEQNGVGAVDATISYTDWSDDIDTTGAHAGYRIQTAPVSQPKTYKTYALQPLSFLTEHTGMTDAYAPARNVRLSLKMDKNIIKQLGDAGMSPANTSAIAIEVPTKGILFYDDKEEYFLPCVSTNLFQTDGVLISGTELANRFIKFIEG